MIRLRRRRPWARLVALALAPASALASTPAAPLAPVDAAVVIALPSGDTAETAPAAPAFASVDAPKGFSYTVVRDQLVDEVADTYLYVRADKHAKATRAIPIPSDRALLASCIAGGGVEDLQRGAIITAKYDPKGVMRPQIVVQRKVEIEVLRNAKVLDRGGGKLYVVTAEGQSRGFEIEGGAAAWNEVVEGGDASQLLMGAKIELRFDPSGREPLRIKVLAAPPGAKREAAGGGGCGCSVRSGRTNASAAALTLAVALLAGIVALRRRGAVAPDSPRRRGA